MFKNTTFFKFVVIPIKLSTGRPKWCLDGPDLSGYHLYLLFNPAYANSQVPLSPSRITDNILVEKNGFHNFYYNNYSVKQCVINVDQVRRAGCMERRERAAAISCAP